MCEGGRRSGCPQSLLQRSSAGLPCPSCSGAQGTTRGGRGRQEEKEEVERRSRIKESAPWME